MTNEQEIDQREYVISLSEKFKRLNEDADFKEFLRLIEAKKAEYLKILTVSKIVGSVDRKNINNANQYFKFTAEEDYARMKEAQIRLDSFNRVIEAIPDIIQLAEIYKEEIEKEKKMNEKVGR